MLFCVVPSNTYEAEYAGTRDKEQPNVWLRQNISIVLKNSYCSVFLGD